MANPAPLRMTVDAFLAWDGDADTRYELVDGTPQAMAPTNIVHQAMAARLTTAIGAALARRPECTAFSEAGVRSVLSSAAFFIADIAVSCRPLRGGDSRMVADPVLLVEILSPSTEETDRKVKVPDYRAMPSVEEILLIDPNRLYAEIHRRFDATRWLTELVLRDTDALRLDSIGLSVPLRDLYRGFPAMDAAAG